MASPMAVPAQTGKRSDRVLWSVVTAAFFAGMAVDVLVATFAHRREAWDSPFYWQVGWPLMVLTGFVGGWIVRRRPWMIGWAPFLGSFVSMTLRSGELGNLWPLGVALTLVIGVPAIGAAWLGGVLANKFSE